jgi:hypothetical protein
MFNMQFPFRLDHLQGPFDQFWLPPLMCVYKFDYWLDDEDWYIIEFKWEFNEISGTSTDMTKIGCKATRTNICLLVSFIVMIRVGKIAHRRIFAYINLDL